MESGAEVAKRFYKELTDIQVSPSNTHWQDNCTYNIAKLLPLCVYAWKTALLSSLVWIVTEYYYM